MGPRAGLDRCGKSRPPTRIRSPDLPTRSESLYRLSYPGPLYSIVVAERNRKSLRNSRYPRLKFGCGNCRMYRSCRRCSRCPSGLCRACCGDCCGRHTRWGMTDYHSLRLSGSHICRWCVELLRAVRRHERKRGHAEGEGGSLTLQMVYANAAFISILYLVSLNRVLFVCQLVIPLYGNQINTSDKQGTTRMCRSVL